MKEHTHLLTADSEAVKLAESLEKYGITKTGTIRGSEALAELLVADNLFNEISSDYDYVTAHRRGMSD